MGKIIGFKYNYDNLLNDYKSALKGEDVPKACSLFERIQNHAEADIYLLQAGLYSKVNDIAKEVDMLLKFLTCPGFNAFNPMPLLYKLNLYFYVYNALDRFDYYRNMIIDRFDGMITKEDLPSPNKVQEEDGLRLVDDNGKLMFFAAMDMVVKGKDKDAIETLNKIDKDDPFYQKVINLKSMVELSHGNIKEAENVLLDAIKEGTASPESYSSLYRAFSYDKEISQEALDMIYGLNSDGSDHDLVMLKVFAAVAKNDYSFALNELLKITSIYKYTRLYLDKLALCYYKLNKKEKLIEVLKRMLTLYPSEALIRYILIKLEEGEDVFDEFAKTTLKSASRTKLKKYLKGLIKNASFIKNLTEEDAKYIFNLSLTSKDFDLIRTITKHLLKGEYKSIVLDRLISVELDNANRQIVFQAIIEECYKEKFYTLIDGYLRLIDVKYPKLFEDASLWHNEEKIQYFKSIYSQSYSLLIFTGTDVSDFKDKIEPILDYLYFLKTDSEEDKFIQNSDNVIYMLTYYIDNNNDAIEASFNFLGDEKKAEIKEFLHKIITKI